MKKLNILMLTLAALLFLTLSAQGAGPRRGSLVIVGGAMRDPAIVERFLQLAGGPDSPIVVIPTAGGRDRYTPSWRGLEIFRKAGATRLTVLHTRDRTVADSEDFVQAIRGASGAFITGGRQWRLADAYLNTRTQRELEALLDRGGVIGGSSAGATIQGSFLVRGDTRTNTIMIGDHVEGFGFLKDVAIDQHLLKRNRQFDMIEVIEKNPHLLGIGIDENTALVVQQDRCQIIGQGYVAIYDHQRQIPPHGKFFLLAPGDIYNLETREAQRPVRVMRSIGRVEKKDWRQ